MNSQKIIFVILGCILVGICAILLFIFEALPLINSPAVAAIIGVLVGGFAGLLGSVVTSMLTCMISLGYTWMLCLLDELFWLVV